MHVISDFEDYYDAALQRGPAEGTLFRRRESLPRNEAFRVMEALGWPTVPHGTVRQLHGLVGEMGMLVVYLDDLQHGVDAAGNDPLVLLDARSALERYPDHLCSFYAPLSFAKRILSYTHLVIGARTFRLRYWQQHEIGTSPTAWASNRDLYGVEIINELPAEYPPKWFRPLIWSIDYTICRVPGSEIAVPAAFDLNTGPMLRGTGISHILPAEVVAELLEDAARMRHVHRGSTLIGWPSGDELELGGDEMGSVDALPESADDSEATGESESMSYNETTTTNESTTGGSDAAE